MPQSILLIGGAGYIGPVIAEELLSDGHSVTVLDNLTYDNAFALASCASNKDFRFIQGDMNDEATVKGAATGVTDVVLLGGLVGDPITKKYPVESRLVNDVAVRNCIEILSKCNIEHLVFISTCSNYGLIPDGAFADENYPTAPLSLYAKSKVENEQFLLSGVGPKAPITTVLRFATAFGVAPRMRFDLTINEFTRDIVLGKELLVFDPDTWRPYCHVRDFAEVIRLVLGAPKAIVANQIFNSGSEANNYTKRQIIEIIQGHVPNSNVQFKDHGTDPRNYKVDFSKIRNELGFSARYTVEDGILEVIDGIKSLKFDFDSRNPNYFGNYVLVNK